MVASSEKLCFYVLDSCCHNDGIEAVLLDCILPHVERLLFVSAYGNIEENTLFVKWYATVSSEANSATF